MDLRVVFSDSREAELDDFEKRIDHDEAVQFILGISYAGPNSEKAAAHGVTAAQFFDPKTHFDGTTVLAGDKSEFGMEVLTTGTAVPPEDRDGLAYTPLRYKTGVHVAIGEQIQDGSGSAPEH